MPKSHRRNPDHAFTSCNQFDNTTSLSDLSLCLLAEPSRTHNQWDFGDSALAENFRVAEGKEVEDGDGVFLVTGEVFVALLGGNEGPELIQVDNRLPEVVSLLVEIPHSDLSKVTGMVLVHVCSVVMLSTSQTSTTGMLAMLSYTTVAGGDVTAVLAGFA